jgi:hypothetical protein
MIFRTTRRGQPFRFRGDFGRSENSVGMDDTRKTDVALRVGLGI